MYQRPRSNAMPFITTSDGVEIFYKDWGTGQPIVFSHGWPLSADDWDAQMMYFLHKGYRVIAHDRRGHGRSSQVTTGNDMDHWVADLAALTKHLDLRNAVHIGHSTGGGEVARYVARHQDRVSKAVLVASLTPNMVQTKENSAGQPPEWFDAVQAGILSNRSEFYRAVPEGPFYGYNRPEAIPSVASTPTTRRWLRGRRTTLPTSSRSPFRFWSCTVRTIRSYHSPVPYRGRSSI
jgi:pimeloyl-ACP methyl ester carboxylesterase